MNIEWLEERYRKLIVEPSAINEHLPTLRALASECETVIEFGTEMCRSANAFVLGAQLLVTSIDHLKWNPERYLPTLKDFQEKAGKRFRFIQGTTLDDSLVSECDLLFIDSKHSCPQVLAELTIHGHKAQKFIVFHDTVSFGLKGDDGGPGIRVAIFSWLSQNPNWRVIRDDQHNCGLFALQRMSV